MKSILLIFSLMIVGSALLASGKKNETAVVKNKNLKTEANFTNGANVLGQYKTSKDADASVEQEKKRMDIVEPRKTYEFQFTKSKEWH